MNLAAEKQPLVSEIIADQQKEIESLKVELQKIKNENPDKIDRNKEDLFIRFQDYTTKLQYMLDSTIDCIFRLNCALVPNQRINVPE